MTIKSYAHAVLTAFINNEPMPNHKTFANITPEARHVFALLGQFILECGANNTSDKLNELCKAIKGLDNEL